MAFKSKVNTDAEYHGLKYFVPKDGSFFQDDGDGNSRALSREGFSRIVDELLKLDEVLQLNDFAQHYSTSRLIHSINVSYYSYIICKKLNWDYKSAARAGMLHDLFLYDWRVQKQTGASHAKVHPVVALENAGKLVELNDIEKDAISTHMWPLTFEVPKYRESIAVSMADKFSACAEFFGHIGDVCRQKFRLCKNVLFGNVYAKY